MNSIQLRAVVSLVMAFILAGCSVSTGDECEQLRADRFARIESAADEARTQLALALAKVRTVRTPVPTEEDLEAATQAINAALDALGAALIPVKCEAD